VASARYGKSDARHPRYRRSRLDANESRPDVNGTTGRLGTLEDPSRSHGALEGLYGRKGRLGHLSDAHVRALVEGSGITPKAAAGSAGIRRSDLLRAALEYAARGWPVFPCKQGGKEPLTARGHLGASTDPRRITAWWNRWPDANIGVPTGERSGLLVLDVDHPAGLNALEAEYGELTATRTHTTGNGGMHHLYRYPGGGEREIRNSVSKLAPGLDVRGEGGYVIVPPSATTRPYELLEDLPPAPPPEWCLETLSQPQRSLACRERAGARTFTAAISADLDGPAIPEGTRDDTLARIAGRLHDGSRGLDELAGELLEVNAARCSPPLPRDQVLKIAASIHRRKPCRRPHPKPTKEVLETLGRIRAGIEAIPWPKVGPKGERDTTIALVKLAGERGELVPCGGVRVSIGVRPLALAYGGSKATLTRKNGIIDRLRRKGIIRRDDNGRSETKAGTFVLMPPEAWTEPLRAYLTHSPTGEGTYETSAGFSGSTLRASYSAPRLRWGMSSGGRRRRGTVKDTRRVRESVPAGSRVGVRRLGKGCGQVVDVLEYSGKAWTEEDLYARLNPHKNPEDRKRWRPRDLRRRVLLPLQAAGVIEVQDVPGAPLRWSLAPDWREALNRERADAGEIEAQRRDMKRYGRERDAYRANLERHKKGIGLDNHPANHGADGWIEELRPQEEAASSDVGPGASERREVPVSGLGRTLKGYLDRSPRDACQHPSWLGLTLWAFELVDRKPTPQEIKEAIGELGGETYLRGLLERARAA
jgi:Bifunctional DNA primase/polymerase, N-terminal